MEQETSARIAQLSAQLGQVAEDAERAAAACAAEHARKIAELEDRGFKAVHQVGNQHQNEAALGYATDCFRRSRACSSHRESYASGSLLVPQRVLLDGEGSVKS